MAKCLLVHCESATESVVGQAQAPIMPTSRSVNERVGMVFDITMEELLADNDAVFIVQVTPDTAFQEVLENGNIPTSDYASDFDGEVTIRAEPFTALQAINRQLTHYAYHVGQIVMLAKQEVGEDWPVAA